MPEARRIPPGYTVIHPNRDKAVCKATRAIVVLILLVSVALILLVALGGWSKLEGLKPLNFAWCLVYLAIAVYVARWARGLLPIAAALAILLLIIAVIAATGTPGTSWFDRNHYGFAHPQSIFAGSGLGAGTLGLITVLIVPVQVLLIFFAMQGFAQGWNVEVEVPIEEAKRRRGRAAGPQPPAPAAYRDPP
jgi:hypothetical protein